VKTRRFLLRALKGTVIGAVVLLAACIIVEQLLEMRDKSAVTADDAFLTANGKQVRYRLLGADKPGPTVVLLTGIAGNIEQWDSVQTAIAAQRRVLTYDRAGEGFSDAARGYDAASMADELEAVLKAANVDRAYVLVSYSASAFMARIFTARHPELVKGLVFIDPTTRDNRSSRPPYSRVTYWRDMGPWLTRSTVYSLVGYTRFRDYLQLHARIPGSPVEARARRIHLRSRHWIASAREGLSLEKSARQAETAVLPESIPVSVLSTYSPGGDAMTLAEQQQLLHTSRGTFQYLGGVLHGDLLNSRVNQPVIDLIQCTAEPVGKQDRNCNQHATRGALVTPPDWSARAGG
jgi:pimeloyl-ACP methyl ester carboxylesterase